MESIQNMPGASEGMATIAKRRRKRIRLPYGSRLTYAVVKELDSLLEFREPRELNKHLRDVFMLFLCHEHKGLPNEFERIADSFFFLFRFLDKVEDEVK